MTNQDDPTHRSQEPTSLARELAQLAAAERVVDERIARLVARDQGYSSASFAA